MCWEGEVPGETPGAPGPHMAAAKTFGLKLFGDGKRLWLVGSIFPPELTWPDSKAFWDYLYPRGMGYKGMEPLPLCKIPAMLRGLKKQERLAQFSALSQIKLK